MLVTTTLVLLVFALWTATGWLRAVVVPDSQAAMRRERAWVRLQFLGGLGVLLVVEYAVYLSPAGRS
jgi:hypothetical protein